MIQLPAKPVGATIEVQNDFNSIILSWNNPRGGFKRVGALLFLLFWMGGWFFGEKSAFNQIMKDPTQLFLLFWLGAWTVGGLYCVVMIFNLARPSRPERITLDLVGLSYAPGTEPIPFGSQARKTNPLALLKPKRVQQVARKDIGEMRIDRVGERQRFTLDVGAKRIEIGEFLEEPEREWLFTVLQSWKGR